MVKKNVLVLTGSPRIQGNSDLLADAFIKGARDAGHDVINVRLPKSILWDVKPVTLVIAKENPVHLTMILMILLLLLNKQI